MSIRQSVILMPRPPQVSLMSPATDGSTSTLDPPVLDDPPDGGTRAWLVVFGSTLALFSTTGVINAYGVFQDYYTQTLLSQSPSSTIALIGGLQAALVYGGGPITGRIFDACGLNFLFPMGASLVVLSLMLISVCQANRPYQFFLAQGVMCGLGSAMIFTPALAVMGHWFKRRRAFVLGIVVAGSSLGGVIYPIALRHLLWAVGFGWAVRIAGLITLACLTVARIATRTRRPIEGTINLSHIVDLQGFRDIRYSLTTLASFLYFYALFNPYFYIEEYAMFRGIPRNVSFYLLAIINGCGVPARIIPGLLGDRLGVLPVLIPPTVLVGTTVISLLLPLKGTAPIVSFSVFYGFLSSGFVSMLPAYVATISPIENFGARLGTLYFFVAVACLVGAQTGGAFVPTPTQANFNRLFIFTGVLQFSAAALIGLAHLVTKMGWHMRIVTEDSTREVSSPRVNLQDPESLELATRKPEIWKDVQR